jgi:anthranilate phosphoribosyltransferase
MRTVLARALAGLGTKRAWVVRSTDGMDELSPHAPTRVTELSGGTLREFVIAPEDFGLSASPAGAIHGGNPKENAAALELVLDGKPHSSRDAFVLNAAAALVVAEGIEPKVAADRARESLASGAARRVLETWKRIASSRRPSTGG